MVNVDYDTPFQPYGRRILAAGPRVPYLTLRTRAKFSPCQNGSRSWAHCASHCIRHSSWKCPTYTSRNNDDLAV